MRKEKPIPAPTPQETTLRAIEVAKGVLALEDPRLSNAAQQLLSLPQGEQITVVRWMQTQPEWAGLLVYLAERAGVSGEVRRAVKQALYTLRQQGIALPEATPQQSPSGRERWFVEEVFVAAPYYVEQVPVGVQFRFFLMQQPSGQREAFVLTLNFNGYFEQATLVTREVDSLHEECLSSLVERLQEATGRNQYLRVPPGWALRAVESVRQRHIQEHYALPSHAAFYWGRLADAIAEAVPEPIASLSDAETNWFISPLVNPTAPLTVPGLASFFLLPYIPPADVLQVALAQASQEAQTRLILPNQSEEQRRQQLAERAQQIIFSNEALREHLLFMLPLYANILLLGGELESARWLKALWRELHERPDRPLHETHLARLLLFISVSLLRRRTEEQQRTVLQEA